MVPAHGRVAGARCCDHGDVAAPRRSPAAVYELLAPAVLGYFRSHRVRDPEGLVGDVFVAVTERLGRFSGDDAALRRWVFTIAHHRMVDETRRAVRRPEVLTAAPESPPAVDPAPFDPALVAALQRLTPDQREVVVLRFLGDLSVADVARITRRRPGAVKMLQARGLEALAAHLREVAEPAISDRP